MEQGCNDEVALGYNHKKNLFWVKWVYIFNIKHGSVDNCLVPKNATWVIRKILEFRKVLLSMSSMNGGVADILHIVVIRDKFFIKRCTFP